MDAADTETFSYLQQTKLFEAGTYKKIRKVISSDPNYFEDDNYERLILFYDDFDNGGSVQQIVSIAVKSAIIEIEPLFDIQGFTSNSKVADA